MQIVTARAQWRRGPIAQITVDPGNQDAHATDRRMPCMHLPDTRSSLTDGNLCPFKTQCTAAPKLLQSGSTKSNICVWHSRSPGQPKDNLRSGAGSHLDLQPHTRCGDQNNKKHRNFYQYDTQLRRLHIQSWTSFPTSCLHNCTHALSLSAKSMHALAETCILHKALASALSSTPLPFHQRPQSQQQSRQARRIDKRTVV